MGENTIQDFANLLQNIINFLYTFTGITITMLGWTLVLLLPIYAYTISFKMYKTNMSHGSVANVSQPLLHTKSAFTALVTEVISILMITFIFKFIIGIDMSNTADLIKAILKINKVFPS